MDKQLIARSMMVVGSIVMGVGSLMYAYEIAKGGKNGK